MLEHGVAYLVDFQVFHDYGQSKKKYAIELKKRRKAKA